MTTWIPKDSRVKIGTMISLDKCPDRWLVAEIFQTMDADNLQRGWGLDLPKSQRTER